MQKKINKKTKYVNARNMKENEEKRSSGRTSAGWLASCLLRFQTDACIHLRPDRGDRWDGTGVRCRGVPGHSSLTGRLRMLPWTAPLKTQTFKRLYPWPTVPRYHRQVCSCWIILSPFPFPLFSFPFVSPLPLFQSWWCC